MFFALATEHDYWMKKINLFVALAPVVKLSNTQAVLIKWAAKLDRFLGWGLHRFNKQELFKLGSK